MDVGQGARRALSELEAEKRSAQQMRRACQCDFRFALPATLTQVLRDLNPGSTRILTRIAAGLETLGNVANSLSTIYRTDLQKSACRNLTACPVPQD